MAAAMMRAGMITARFGPEELLVEPEDEGFLALAFLGGSPVTGPTRYFARMSLAF